MDTGQIARLAYLLLLALAVGGYFFAQNRGQWPKLAQQFAVWVLIFVGVIAGYGLWGDIQRQLRPAQVMLQDGTIEVPRMADGHFYLAALVNGEKVDFVVDTGASDIVLTREDAARVGLDPADLAFTGIAGTANGTVRTAPARVDEIRIGAVVDRNVPVSVNSGEMDGSLLGMSYLRRFSRIEIAGDRLLLKR
ncbi:MAG: TIGR02281 family clan AA aspartic protease [Alphaproteobacteria bacterium]|nr:MAG: TIGR02281 family clan AA aspartic protease [Alphaproteobacteria bacterium]